MEEILKNAKELRKNQTNQEKKLWYELRNRRFFDLKFKRQVPIGNYVVDFLCVEKMLIIELDGGQHNFDKNVVYDKQRTIFLEGLGYKVLRFWNNDINENLEGVPTN